MFPKKEAEFVMNDLCLLPSLTRMIAPINTPVPKAFFYRHPLITDFSGQGPSITDLVTCLPHLAKLEWFTGEDIGTVFRHLGRIPYLKEVAIRCSTTDEEAGEFPSDLDSPGWTHFTDDWQARKVHSIVLNQTRNTLVYLRLWVSISSLVNDLSLTLPELERLQSLELILVASEANIPLKPPHKQKICQVRNMEIKFLPLEKVTSPTCA